MKKDKNRFPPLPAGKRRQYTDNQRIEILRLLKENSYNYRKTALDTGVPYPTIKVWYSKFKNEINEMTAVSCIAEKVELNIAQLKTEFIEKHFKEMNTLAQEAIKRAGELIKSEEDLSKVNGTIKVVTEFIVKMTENSPSSNKSAETINIIQQTISNLNTAGE